MYRNQLLLQAPATERQALADAVARTSPANERHINLQGDFTSA
ncbi:hypothetical protein [Hymenobacter terricola]|nr:hypothetical protein [Hymenobacter terricola]